MKNKLKKNRTDKSQLVTENTEEKKDDKSASKDFGGKEVLRLQVIKYAQQLKFEQ